jgi:hypothetical protein
MNKVASLQYLKIAAVVLLSCAALFSLDSETRSVSDLFTPENISAWVIYAIPTIIICSLLYWAVNRKGRKKGSMTLSLAVGIPVSFVIIITLLYWKLK